MSQSWSLDLFSSVAGKGSFVGFGGGSSLFGQSQSDVNALFGGLDDVRDTSEVGAGGFVCSSSSSWFVPISPILGKVLNMIPS